MSVQNNTRLMQCPKKLASANKITHRTKTSCLFSLNKESPNVFNSNDCIIIYEQRPTVILMGSIPIGHCHWRQGMELSLPQHNSLKGNCYNNIPTYTVIWNKKKNYLLQERLWNASGNILYTIDSIFIYLVKIFWNLSKQCIFLYRMS